jgi:hypothetical protein
LTIITCLYMMPLERCVWCDTLQFQCWDWTSLHCTGTGTHSHWGQPHCLISTEQLIGISVRIYQVDSVVVKFTQTTVVVKFTQTKMILVRFGQTRDHGFGKFCTDRIDRGYCKFNTDCIDRGLSKLTLLNLTATKTVREGCQKKIPDSV